MAARKPIGKQPLEFTLLCSKNPDEGRALIRRALRREAGCMSKASRALGVSKSVLRRLLIQLDIPGEQERQRRAAARRFRLL